jgi:hypothetical protein
MGDYTRRQGGKMVSILDEGITIVDEVGSIDFQGAGVSGTAIGDAATETIPSTDLTGHLALDQTTPQTVQNGAPEFQNGVKIGNSTTYFVLTGNKLQLYVNSILKEEWEQAPVHATGEYIGFGAFTYANT